jgi:hypothetical protein
LVAYRRVDIDEDDDDDRGATTAVVVNDAVVNADDWPRAARITNNSVEGKA